MVHWFVYLRTFIHDIGTSAASLFGLMLLIAIAGCAVYGLGAVVKDVYLWGQSWCGQ